MYSKLLWACNISMCQYLCTLHKVKCTHTYSKTIPSPVLPITSANRSPLEKLLAHTLGIYEVVLIDYAGKARTVSHRHQLANTLINDHPLIPVVHTYAHFHSKSLHIQKPIQHPLDPARLVATSLCSHPKTVSSLAAVFNSSASIPIRQLRLEPLQEISPGPSG